MKKIFFLLLLLALVSCKGNRSLTSAVSRNVVIEKQFDTVLFTLPDSASIVALIRCDSLGNAYLSEIAKLKTGRAVRPSLTVKDNKAIFDCKVDSMAVYLNMYRRFESQTDTTSVIRFIEKKPGLLERFVDGFLLISLGALVGSIILLLLWRKK
ncbi:hypothetical protein SDC9_23459 [bioreactor metagenome]|uniref:Lipoprotein n=1 Tax=bioreactor metagenome TaxID=1076179 RepID=A0A644UFJ1_9ZZZZ